MDILDFLENMGFGAGIVIIVAAVLFLMALIGAILPGLLASMGAIIIALIMILIIGAIIYFIGKFAKDFIKK